MTEAQGDRGAEPEARPAQAARRQSRAPRLNRRLHRIGALVSALPVLVVVVSGLFLQLKKEWTWVQPATVRGSTTELRIDWDAVLASAASVGAQCEQLIASVVGFSIAMPLGGVGGHSGCASDCCA